MSFNINMSQLLKLGAHIGLLFTNTYQQQKKTLLNQ